MLITEKEYRALASTRMEDFEVTEQACIHLLSGDISVADFVKEIVDFYCVANEVHPFRKSNGRTLRAVLTQLIRNAGYDISFTDMDTEFLMIATIRSVLCTDRNIKAPAR